MAVPKGFLRLDGLDGHAYIRPNKVTAFTDWTPIKNEPRTRIILETFGGSYEVIVAGTADELSEALTKARK